jgi:hypothetical protein
MHCGTVNSPGSRICVPAVLARSVATAILVEETVASCFKRRVVQRRFVTSQQEPRQLLLSPGKKGLVPRVYIADRRLRGSYRLNRLSCDSPLSDGRRLSERIRSRRAIYHVLRIRYWPQATGTRRELPNLRGRDFFSRFVENDTLDAVANVPTIEHVGNVWQPDHDESASVS